MTNLLGPEILTHSLGQSLSREEDSLMSRVSWDGSVRDWGGGQRVARRVDTEDGTRWPIPESFKHRAEVLGVGYRTETGSRAQLIQSHDTLSYLWAEQVPWVPGDLGERSMPVPLTSYCHSCSDSPPSMCPHSRNVYLYKD